MGRTMVTSSSVRGYKKKKKSRLAKAIIMIMLVMIALVCVLFFTPIFNIKEIVVLGNEKLEAQFVIDSSGIMNGTNLFTADIGGAKRSIAQISYVENVKLTRKLPNKIVIAITESKPAALIPFVSGYVVVDKNGKVLEAVTEKGDKALPVLVGTGILKCELGKPIEFNNKDQLSTFRTCVSGFMNAGLLDKITTIDLSNIYEIQVVVSKQLYVNYGSENEFDYKTQLLINVLGNIANPPKGYLDLRTTKNVAYKENYKPEGGYGSK